jgi:hypothetical protein
MHNVNHYSENYDELTVDEVVQQLGGLSAEELDGVSVDELRTIGDYERRNKDRGTLLQEIERNIEAVS